MNSCITSNVSCNSYTPGKCIYYSGRSLPCTGIIYNDSIDLALQKLDSRVCSVISGQIVTAPEKVQLVVGVSNQAIPKFSPTPADGATQVVINYQIVPKSEIIFYQGVKVDINPSFDFNWSAVYNPTSTVYTFSQPLSLGNPLQFNFTKIINGGSSSITSTGVQTVKVLVATTGFTLTVPELGEFVAMLYHTNSYDDTYITQSGTTLDCSNIGGVFAGDRLTILYYP